MFALNWNNSVIHGAIFRKFSTLVPEGYLEGTVSENVCLALSFYFMKSRKFVPKKWRRAPVF